MKRQWGFDHIMTKKTKARASADVGFIFIAYNLRRIINIIGIEPLITFLKAGLTSFFALQTKIRRYIDQMFDMMQVLRGIQKIRFLDSSSIPTCKSGKLVTLNTGF